MSMRCTRSRTSWRGASNGMKFTADGGDEWTVYSIGGGALSEGKAEGDMFAAGGDVYEMHKIKDIMAWCKKTGHGYWEYVEQCEGPEIWDFLNEVFDTIEKAVHSSPTLQLGRPQGKFL